MYICWLQMYNHSCSGDEKNVVGYVPCEVQIQSMLSYVIFLQEPGAAETVVQCVNLAHHMERFLQPPTVDVFYFIFNFF